MYKPMILDLIAKCQAAKHQHATNDEIRHRVLPENGRTILCNPTEFLNWVQDDNEYSGYYFDALQSGTCAKPVEVAAMILEEIILEAIEEN